MASQNKGGNGLHPLDITDKFGDSAHHRFSPAPEARPVHARLTLDEKRTIADEYYAQQAIGIFQFFQNEHFEVAEELFLLLHEIKGHDRRKNGYTPEPAHQIDQLLPIITSLQYGGLKKDRKRIEKEYGSVEKWLIGIIVHDMGEDDNMFPDKLENLLRQRLINKYGTVSEKNEALIQRAGRSMERLTHYRKYDIEKLEKLSGLNVTLPEMSEGECVPLGEDFRNFFAKKMRLSEQHMSGLQVYAQRKPGQSKPVIYVTQYGRSSYENGQNGQVFGADWNSYVYSLLLTAYKGKEGHDPAEEDDFYDFLVKMGDRNQGMGSRIAVQNFTPDSYRKYLDQTTMLFSIQNSSRLGHKLFYPGSPLTKTLLSLDGMMGCLNNIGRLYLQYHPDNKNNGERDFSVRTLLDMTARTGINPLYFSNYVDKSGYLYGQCPTHSHPMAMIMRELREADHAHFTEDHKQLYVLIKDAIVENGLVFHRLFEGHLGNAEPFKSPYIPKDLMGPVPFRG